MADKVKTCYVNGVCPDCAEPISETAVEGDECSNCRHVFWYDHDDFDENWSEDFDENWSEDFDEGWGIDEDF